MNCEKIIVKNEPVCFDNQSGRPIRFEKRPISTQQHSKDDTSKTSWKRSKPLRQQIRGDIKSEPIEVQVKKEPSADAVNESSTESSHKCNICQKLFVNLRSLNKHARVHSDEEAKKSDEETKQKEVKSEPIDLEKYRIKQELERELEDKELEALERRNQPMTTASIAFLRQTDEPAEPEAAQVETQEPAEQRQDAKQTTNNRSIEPKKRNNTKQRIVKSGKPAATQARDKRSSEKKSKRATNTKERLVETGKKSYECEWCSKAFKTSNELTVHCRIHTGERPYKCMICKNTFNRHSNLERHGRIHTGEKPYQCEICKKEFTDSPNFAKHRRFHSKAVKSSKRK